MTIPSTPAKGKTLATVIFSMSPLTTNIGHGHVFPRPDGVRMRCGGPSMCRECQRDQAEAVAHSSHLAEQWQELRKAKAEAERVVRAHMEDGGVCCANVCYLTFVEVSDALATFEQQNGIGGGT